MTNPLPKLCIVKEAAALLRIAPRALLELERAGKIAYVQWNKRVVRFEQEAIDEFLEKVRFIAGGQVPPRKRKPQ